MISPITPCTGVRIHFPAAKCSWTLVSKLPEPPPHAGLVLLKTDPAEDRVVRKAAGVFRAKLRRGKTEQQDLQQGLRYASSSIYPESQM